MFTRLLPQSRRPFSSLSEEEILALAIASEEEDARIYLAYADGLRDRYPGSAKVFEDMAEVEQTHKNMLIGMFQSRFGERIPLIRREHVRGFYQRKPDWLRKNLSLETVRMQAEMMEEQAARFYREATTRVSDASTRQLLGDLALAEEGHGDIARMLEGKHVPEDTLKQENEDARRQFILTYVQPGLAGDGGQERLVVLGQHCIAAAMEQRAQQGLAGGGRGFEPRGQGADDRPHAAHVGPLDQGLGDGFAHGQRPPLGQGRQDVLLVDEVLVDRPDADPRALGHVVGGQAVRSVGLEKLKGGVQNRVHGRAGATLPRGSASLFRHFVLLPVAPGRGSARRVGT